MLKIPLYVSSRGYSVTIAIPLKCLEMDVGTLKVVRLYSKGIVEEKISKELSFHLGKGKTTLDLSGVKDLIGLTRVVLSDEGSQLVHVLRYNKPLPVLARKGVDARILSLSIKYDDRLVTYSLYVRDGKFYGYPLWVNFRVKGHKVIISVPKKRIGIGRQPKILVRVISNVSEYVDYVKGGRARLGLLKVLLDYKVQRKLRIALWIGDSFIKEINMRGTARRLIGKYYMFFSREKQYAIFLSWYDPKLKRNVVMRKLITFHRRVAKTVFVIADPQWMTKDEMKHPKAPLRI